MNICDMLLICAMGPPGGGRTFITSRLLRHMNLISIAEVIEILKKNYKLIYFSLMMKHFREYLGRF